MAGKISLNLVIDGAKNRVVFAESDRDFVDVLLSFLVMPVGTAVRLAGGKSGLCCMDALYKSVESLDVKVFKTEACKKMLLFPVDADRANCLGLAVSINDRCLHYRCPDWEDGGGKHRYWSTIKGAKCSCGKAMDVTSVPVYSDGEPSDVGVFLRGMNKYLITDDLHVSPICTLSMDELRKLGVDDLSRLREKKVEIGEHEVLNLFKYALLSKTPLTDTFIVRIKVEENINREALETASTLKPPANAKERKMSMDVVVNKSDGKVLYAQATEDVVNFFFSFLTFPLGLISNIYSGSSSLGCIDNLWSSAKLLSEKGQLRTDEHSNILLKPKVASQHSFKDQILNIEEGSNTLTRSKITLHAINPKCTSFTTEKGGSFVNGPATFMITDELDVKLASVSEGISIIRNYNDMEVITVTVSEVEALMLLKASLTSSTPLSTVFIAELQPYKTASSTKVLPSKGRINKKLPSKRRINKKPRAVALKSLS